MKKNIGFVKSLLFPVLILFSINVNAVTLYATDGGSHDRTLYSIDTTSGQVTRIGSIGYGVSDIGWDKTSNTLYGVTKSRQDGFFEGLIKINTQTGVGTEIGTGGAERLLQIDIDSKGNIYGSDGNTIYSINSSTGVFTDAHPLVVQREFAPGFVFPINASLGKYGMAFDSEDKLWTSLGNLPSTFGSTDLETGDSTISARYEGNSLIYSGGIDLQGSFFSVGRHGTFDQQTDLYWALLDGVITKYDMTDGSVVETLALVGAPDTPLFSQPFQNIRSLAFASPVPVPATVWLLASGLIGLFGMSNRKNV